MATFYVLPSRHLLGQRFSELLATIFPGTYYAHWDWPDLAESLAGFVETASDAYVVYREDLNDDMNLKDALVRDFGAAQDDEFIEVQLDTAVAQILRGPWATMPTRRAA